MPTPKKIWKTPQLIILSRDSAEENVLLACKFFAKIINPSYKTKQKCTKIVVCSNSAKS